MPRWCSRGLILVFVLSTSNDRCVTSFVSRRASPSADFIVRPPGSARLFFGIQHHRGRGVRALQRTWPPLEHDLSTTPQRGRWSRNCRSLSQSCCQRRAYPLCGAAAITRRAPMILAELRRRFGPAGHASRARKVLVQGIGRCALLPNSPPAPFRYY